MRNAVLLTVLAVVGAVAGAGGSPVAGAALADQPFNAWGSGTVIGFNALQAGTTTLAAANVAHAGGSVDSQGLQAIADELGQNVSPARGDRNAYGRGAGVQVGLGTPVPSQADVNQINVSGLAQALAPPPDSQVRSIPVNLSPVLAATTATGRASALYHPNFCPIGKPFSYGEGEVENLQVLNPPNVAPLLATVAAGQNVSESRTVTYAVPNGDGTFGLVSETRMIVAPIAVGPEVLGQPTIGIEIAGPIVMRVIATGKPGGADVQFSGTPVITLRSLGVPLAGTPLTLAAIVGMNGLSVPIPLIANIDVGVPPHAIGQPGVPVQKAADGTSASAAVDVVKLQLLPGLLGLTSALDVRVGHMEGAVRVPQGGITCEIPVSKSGSPDPVTAGHDFTIKIRIPADSGQFAEFFGCDLLGIAVVDEHGIESGNPSFTLVSASHGGRISGNTVTWDNVGNYTVGDPPIELTVTGHVPVGSGAGVLKDTASVSATLGNCRGGADGQDIVGQALNQIGQRGLKGAVTLLGPNVIRAGGGLAATGGDARLLVLGGAFLLGALAVRRHLRRAVPDRTG